MLACWDGLDKDDPDPDIALLAKGCEGLEITADPNLVAPDPINGFFKGPDPWRNVAVLRLVVAPTWMSIFPLMVWIHIDWRSIESGYSSKTGLAKWAAIFTTPVIPFRTPSFFPLLSLLVLSHSFFDGDL